MLMYVLLVLDFNMVRFNTILHGNDNGKQRSAPNSQFTPEIRGENCEYIEKDNTVLHRFHTAVLRVYRIYAVRKFINTRVFIWNFNNDGLYLTIASEIIASNKKWNQTIRWNFWYFDIAWSVIQKAKCQRRLCFLDRNYSYTCAIGLFNTNLVTFALNVLLSCDQAALRKVLSFCPSIRLSVTLVIFTMLLSSYHHKIVRGNYQCQERCPDNTSRKEVNGQGHSGQS